MHHAILSLGAVEVELQNHLVDGVATLFSDAGDGALCARRQEDLVLAEQTVLEDDTEDVSTSDMVANLEVTRCEIPLLLTVQSGNVDTTGNVDTIGDFGNALERALNTIVDGLEKTWAELDGQRLAGAVYRVANSDTSWNTLVTDMEQAAQAYQSPRRPE